MEMQEMYARLGLSEDHPLRDFVKALNNAIGSGTVTREEAEGFLPEAFPSLGMLRLVDDRAWSDFAKSEIASQRIVAFDRFSEQIAFGKADGFSVMAVDGTVVTFCEQEICRCDDDEGDRFERLFRLLVLYGGVAEAAPYDFPPDVDEEEFSASMPPDIYLIGCHPSGVCILDGDDWEDFRITTIAEAIELFRQP